MSDIRKWNVYIGGKRVWVLVVEFKNKRETYALRPIDDNHYEMISILEVEEYLRRNKKNAKNLAKEFVKDVNILTNFELNRLKKHCR